ncbi:MAG: alpha/beta fold hydrolase [Thainema sp.]
MTSTLLSPAPTAAEIEATKQAIEAHIRQITAHPDRRDGAYPYYLFHEPDQPIRGMVMMFHGFSAKPHQMWRLADYLFQNGFNIYQCNIAGHALVNPAVNWPQVDLKPEYAEPLKAKIQQDPVLMQTLQNYQAEGKQPNAMQQAALLARLMMIEPKLLDIKTAIERDGDPRFNDYFISSDMDYLNDARDRIRELDAMPGDIYTLGLSVGGAVALGLAADQPERVKKVVAYAPLLDIYGAERKLYVELTGPLDIKEMGWDPDLQFPVGCLTAADRFGGSYVRSDASIRQLRDIPTLMVLTENEDAADIKTNQRFFEQIGGERQGHWQYLYLTQDMVPHPMVDPQEVSQNMSNRFWQSLYQETFRFLTTGNVQQENFSRLEQASDAPTVADI